MPYKPARPCRYRYCPALTTDRSGYCSEHLRLARQQQDSARGTAAERGYGWRWAEYSRLYRKEHPLCVECEKQGQLTFSEHTDHIIPVKGKDDPRFWDPTNHQALCAYHHRVKTATEDGAFGNVPRKS